jgi:ABC-type sulfate transport system permease component
MTSPIAFPDWVPPWAQLLVLIVGILVGLAFLLMPFSVFGVKSRLETIEARLDARARQDRLGADRPPRRVR